MKEEKHNHPRVPLLKLMTGCFIILFVRTILQNEVMKIIIAFVCGYLVAVFSLPAIIYFIFQAISLKTQPNSKIQTIPKSVPNIDLEEDNSKLPPEMSKEEVKVKGYLKIQDLGPNNCFCALMDNTLYIYSSEKDRVEIELQGVYIKQSLEGPPQIYLIHPSRKLISDIDYIFLMTKDLEEKQLWYYALLSSGCKPYENLYTTDEPDEIEKRKYQNLILELTQDNQDIDKLEFINALLSRIFINIAESSELKTTLLTKLATELSSEISSQSQLSPLISNIIITHLNFGNKHPRVDRLSVHVPKVFAQQCYYDTIIECFITLENAHTGLGLKTKVIYQALNVDIDFNITIKELKGQLRITIPPYPMSKMQVCFASVPHVMLDVNLKIGSEKGISLSLSKFALLQEIINDQIKEAIKKALVAPKFEWVYLPGVSPSSPPKAKPSLPLRDLTAKVPHQEHLMTLLPKGLYDSENKKKKLFKEGKKKEKFFKKKGTSDSEYSESTS